MIFGIVELHLFGIEPHGFYVLSFKRDLKNEDNIHRYDSTALFAVYYGRTKDYDFITVNLFWIRYRREFLHNNITNPQP